MPKITCKQCGAIGWSKNPMTRSIFMDNQLEAGFSQCFNYKVDRTNKEFPTVSFNFKYIIGQGDDNDYEAVVKTFEFIQRYLELVPIKELACNHGAKGWDHEDPYTV